MNSDKVSFICINLRRKKISDWIENAQRSQITNKKKKKFFDMIKKYFGDSIMLLIDSILATTMKNQI